MQVKIGNIAVFQHIRLYFISLQAVSKMLASIIKEKGLYRIGIGPELIRITILTS